MNKKIRIVPGTQGGKMMFYKLASSFTPAKKAHVILEYSNGAASKNEI